MYPRNDTQRVSRPKSILFRLTFTGRKDDVYEVTKKVFDKPVGLVLLENWFLFHRPRGLKL